MVERGGAASVSAGGLLLVLHSLPDEAIYARPQMLLELSCECDVGTRHSEHVARRRADHLPVLGPVDKGVTAGWRGGHRARTAFRKCATAADRAVGTRRSADRKSVLLGIDDQCRNAGDVPLAAREADVIGIGVWSKAARARIYRESDGLR